MTAAISLLMTAMQLLTMVSASPNLPQSFVDNAKSIANTAITIAQDEIAKYNASTTAPVSIPQVTELPTSQNLGTIQPIMETPFVVESTISKKVLKNAGGDLYVEIEINIVDGSNDMTWEGNFINGYHKDKVRPKSQSKDYNWISFSVDKNGEYPITFSLNGKTYVQNITINEL